MTHKHPNVWTAKVHTYMLASKTAATCREIEQMFGRPSGTHGVSVRLSGAMACGWFEAIDKTERPLRYRALEKQPRYQPAPIPTPAITRPFGQIGRNAPRWPSIWAYAHATAGAPAP